jgi:hypothetical protein
VVVTDPYIGQRTLMRAVLDATLPDGSAWNPVPGGDFDHLLDGIGDDLQTVLDFLGTIDDIRNPRTTAYLDDLEREYGISPNSQLSDAQRRATLLIAKYQRNIRGTINNLQTALDRAGLGAGGYGLTVYANDPPVDTGPFTTYAFITECVADLGYGKNQCGYNTDGATVLAVAGSSGGIWVINGDTIFIWHPNYLGCGEPTMCCGYYPISAIMAQCGIFYTVSYQLSPVTSPADPTTWPLVFFIAANVTRQNVWALNDIAPLSLAQGFTGQGGIGQISTLPMISIPTNLRETLVEIILRYKPLHTWCALMCTFN